MKAGFLVSDRNRADLDWNRGALNWLYRNKWSTTEEFAGCLFPVGKNVESNFYEHATTPASTRIHKKTISVLRLTCISQWKGMGPQSNDRTTRIANQHI